MKHSAQKRLCVLTALLMALMMAALPIQAAEVNRLGKIKSEGKIIMVTSPFASRPSAKGGAYAIAKAGQEALMLTLSQELKGTGVTANILQVKQIDMKRAKVSEPAQANAAWTTPEELAAAVTYLLSDAGAALNGAKLPMFGSYS